MNLKITLCLPAASLLNFPFSPTVTIPNSLTFQNIYYLDCVNPSFLEYEPWNALKLSFYLTCGKFVDARYRFNRAETGNDVKYKITT